MSGNQDVINSEFRDSLCTDRRSFVNGMGASLFGLLVGCGPEEGPSSAPVKVESIPELVVNTDISSLPAIPTISPAQSWNGAPGSGFDILPQDPVRVTAKPVLRLLTPPNQYFTDSLTVGVFSAANDGGTLISNLGLQAVRVHFEGQTVDLESPRVHRFQDVNGNEVGYLGWWITLKRPSGKSGHANLYFEAVPRDSSMQNRVIGPFQFSPVAAFASTGTIHDFEVEVAASTIEVPGRRYTTIKSALSWLRDQMAQNPLITITEPGIYNLERYNQNYGAYSGAGYCTIRASSPVKIGNIGEYEGNLSAQARTFYDGMRFSGSNITFDMRTTDAIYSEGGENGRQHWFDGVTVGNSGGRYFLWRKVPRTFGFCRYRPWITECSISDLPNMVNGASLVRGCHLTRGYNDCASDADCVIGNRIHDWNSRPYIDEVPALTVAFQGNGNASLDIVGYNSATSRSVFAKVDGMVVGSFLIDNSEYGWTKGTSYNVRNVVDWLNSLDGWEAVLLDDSRAAGLLSKVAGKGGPFSDLPVGSAPITLVTMADLHADFWQLLEDYSGSIKDRSNKVVVNNKITEFAGQKIFLSASTVEAHDIFFINNAIHDFDGEDYQNEEYLFSQFARGRHSHIVIAHNSMTQAVGLRSENGYRPDRYCLFANNVFKTIFWSGDAISELSLRDNHLFSGQSVPQFAIGTTIGGNVETLFVNAKNGDFSPSTELMKFMKIPVVKHHIGNGTRETLAPLGAAV